MAANTIKTADRLTKCNCCGELIQIGEKIKFKEITRSGGRSNGGYGTAKTINTGKFVVTCHSCRDRSKLMNSEKVLKSYIEDLNTLDSDAPETLKQHIVNTIEFYKKEVAELKQYV